MVGERDSKFYSELKQMNDDLLSFLRTTHEKSPYFDFTPTIHDYVRQMTELDKQYPEKSSSSFSSAITTKPVATTNTTTTTTTKPFSMPFMPTASPFVPVTSIVSSSSPSTASSITQSNSTISQAAPTFLFGSSTNPSLASAPSTQFFSFSLPPKKEEDAVSNNTIATDTSLNNDINGDKNGADEDTAPPEPKIDKYEEPDAKHSVKCKLYEKGKSDGEISVNLLGIGYLYVKSLDAPSKLQVIFRQEPDLRRVLLNEVVTANIPVKLLPKAVQLVFPGSSGETKFYIIKVRDETEANSLYEMLNLTKS